MTPFSVRNATFGFNTQQQQQQHLQSTPFLLGFQQLSTQMAPVAPLPFSMAERDIQVLYFCLS